MANLESRTTLPLAPEPRPPAANEVVLVVSGDLRAAANVAC